MTQVIQIRVIRQFLPSQSSHSMLRYRGDDGRQIPFQCIPACPRPRARAPLQCFAGGTLSSSVGPEVIVAQPAFTFMSESCRQKGSSGEKEERMVDARPRHAYFPSGRCFTKWSLHDNCFFGMLTHFFAMIPVSVNLIR